MNYTITLCYNNPKVVEESINKYYELCYNKPDAHYILNDCYPLHKEELKETLKRLSDKYGCIILESNKNLGLKEGGLFVINEISNLKDDDIFILYDSNCYPLTKDFDKALIDIYKNKNIGICSLSPTYINNVTPIKDEISGLSYIEDINFFTAISSFTYKTHSIIQGSFNMFSKTYGDGSILLSTLKEKISLNNLKYIALIDYKENMNFFRDKEDLSYKRYKEFILNIKPKDHISFDNFLNLDYEKISYGRTSINKEIFHFSGLNF